VRNKLFFLLSLLVAINVSANADDAKIIQGDKVLKALQASLPPNWSMRVENDKITFERNGEVWVLPENQINAPLSLESEAERINRIKTQGTKIKTKLVYRFEAKWTDGKRKEAEKENSRITTEMGGLMNKYKVAHLYDEMLSAKGDDFFNEGTPAEEKRINEYKKAKVSLEIKLIKFPDADTEKYSLFFSEGTGYSDPYQLVYPFEASNESYDIMNRMNSITK
jgi:hypothetical protein